VDGTTTHRSTTRTTRQPASVLARYPLGPDTAVAVTVEAVTAGHLPPGAGYTCSIERTGSDGVWVAAPEADGAAQALVDVLRHEAVQPVAGFRVVRVVPPPAAVGERAVLVDQTNTSVVVGERVVVKWLRHLQDGVHPAPVALEHLAAVGYLGVPDTFGLLLWRAPGGHELPCAIASRYLPRARDGWQWCVELAELDLGLRPGDAGAGDPWVGELPERLGRLAASLHLALATPSRILPEPVRRVPASAVRGWHRAALRRLDEAADVARAGALNGAAEVLLPRVDRLRAAIGGLLGLGEDDVVVQRVHGDLHVGQVLRWARGLAVVDFDGNPVVAADDDTGDPAVQPAARDLAQLLVSVDLAGRVADKRHGFTATAAVDAWSRRARERLLTAYRIELAAAGRAELLDERLLAAFEAEQLCREVAYAAHHLPRWAYAPLGAVRCAYPADAGWSG
jgi:maltokinase